MSYITLSIALAAMAALFYAGFVLYGAWVDGRRQAVRKEGLHPTTEPSGQVHAQEKETGHGS